MTYQAVRDEQDEADEAALAYGPSIVGLTYHFADPAVEQRFWSAVAPQGSRRLTALCWIAMILSLSRLAAPFLGLAHDPGFDPNLPARIVQIAICVAVLGVLRRQRSPQLLEWLGAGFGISYVAIRCWLLPNMTTDGSVAMVVGTVALLFMALPVRLPLLAPASLVGSAIMLWVWSLGSPSPSRIAVLQAVEWVAVINFLGLGAVRMMRLTLRRQYALSEALRHLATHDGLTRIANRRRYDQVLAREWARCREAGQPLSLIVLDVDFFKLLNDHIGHAAGDDCLADLARLLVRCVDRPGALVARTGGEEFAVILPETLPQDARRLAECITTALAKLALPHPHSPIGPHITVSLGVATIYLGQGHTLRDLTGLADRLVYAAKADGRACLRQEVLRAGQARVAGNVLGRAGACAG